MIRLACGELIAGLRGIAHHTSAGDEMTGVIISARRDQALDRLTSLEKVLDACKIRHKRTYQKIQVLDSDFRFQVYTANKDSVVSQTTFYALCDEVARWYDDRTGLNPADEIVRSLNPSLLTDPDACMHLVSSPWVENDLHDRELRAACAHDARAGWWFPTWVGNPTVSEQMTRDEEADERVWSREFAAIPMAEDETSLFDKWAIDAAIEGEREL